MMNSTLTSPLVKLRKQLGRLRRSVERKFQLIWRFLRVDATDPLFWWQTRIRYVSRRPIRLTDKFGVTLLLYPYDALRYVRARQSHFDDEGVLRLVKEFLKPGMTVVDVGANIGQFAIFSAALLRDAGKVHSFEPASDTFGRLEEDIHLHRASGLSGRIRANCLAVGKESGEAVLHKYPLGCSVWNSFNPHTMYAGDQAVTPCGTEKVHVVTLDEYCYEQKVEYIDLLKVDVEGFEADVFLGSMRLIREKRIRQAIFEISLGNFTDGTVDAARILNTIRKLGFDVRLIAPDGALVSIDSEGFKLPYFANYLAIPAEV